MPCLSNQLNQYTNIAASATNTPTYDLDGNMLTYGGWTFGWNGENRLVSASNGATVVTFGYDYMGRRFMKAVGTTTNRYFYDGWAMIRETDGSTTNDYAYGLDLSGSMQGAGTIGGLLMADLGGTTVLYCYDANGNVTELVNTDGTTAAKYQYDPFGNTILADDTDSSGVVSENPFRFSTKYFDAGPDLYYYGYRYYHPELGRWPSRDPKSEEGGLNLYVHVSNDAENRTDSLGLADQQTFSLRNDVKKFEELTKDCTCGRVTVTAWLDADAGSGTGSNPAGPPTFPDTNEHKLGMLVQFDFEVTDDWKKVTRCCKCCNWQQWYKNKKEWKEETYCDVDNKKGCLGRSKVCQIEEKNIGCAVYDYPGPEAKKEGKLKKDPFKSLSLPYAMEFKSEVWIGGTSMHCATVYWGFTVETRHGDFDYTVNGTVKIKCGP